jgi:hypothetical protein
MAVDLDDWQFWPLDELQNWPVLISHSKPAARSDPRFPLRNLVPKLREACKEIFTKQQAQNLNRII